MNRTIIEQMFENAIQVVESAGSLASFDCLFLFLWLVCFCCLIGYSYPLNMKINHNHNIGHNIGTRLSTADTPQIRPLSHRAGPWAAAAVLLLLLPS
jgi:hypothetical protein